MRLKRFAVVLWRVSLLFLKLSIAILDASLPAVCLYEHRGYKTVGHGIYELENDVKLVYEIMEKKLRIVTNDRTDKVNET